jgi:molybdate transport system substrate-binding protein
MMRRAFTSVLDDAAAGWPAVARAQHVDRVRRIGAIMTLSVGTFCLVAGKQAEAAEITIVSGGGIRAMLTELGQQFERDSGHKLTVSFGISAQLRAQIEAGTRFDLAILTEPVPEQLLEKGYIRAPAVRIARVGIGVAVRKGDPKPDISSSAAFKRTLLDAKSISFAAQSGSGVHFAKVIERLGIAEAIKAKARIAPGGALAVVGPVARGEVELGISAMPDIVATPGVEVLGPLPPELQDYLVFTAGIAVGANEQTAARTLVDFLLSPASAAVIRSKGLEPQGSN